MELTASTPRLALLERTIARSPKYTLHLARPPLPPLKLKTVHIQPGQADPPASPGTFTIVVMNTSLEPEAGQDRTPAIGFTPARAEPTAAAGPGAPRGPASRAKRRRPTEEDLLAQIAALEARRDELRHRRGPKPARERVLRQGAKPRGRVADKAAGKHRSGPTTHVTGRRRGGPR